MAACLVFFLFNFFKVTSFWLYHFEIRCLFFENKNKTVNIIKIKNIELLIPCHRGIPLGIRHRSLAHMTYFLLPLVSHLFSILQVRLICIKHSVLQLIYYPKQWHISMVSPRHTSVIKQFQWSAFWTLGFFLLVVFQAFLHCFWFAHFSPSILLCCCDYLTCIIQFLNSVIFDNDIGEIVRLQLLHILIRVVLLLSQEAPLFG